MGNIGSGFGNAASRCGFEDGYYPVHAPLGFPNCANYKGSPEERISDLYRRGYGTNIINAWKKYYEENPDDPLKIDYTIQNPSINNSMSKSAALAEQAAISSAAGNPRTYGTWANRMAMTRKYKANYVKNNIAIRTETINAILSNPVNIKRWENEAYVKKQVEMENQRLENQRLQEIENQRLQEIENKRIENQRLMELENQRIEIEKQKPIIEPEIIPAVVASSSLIPLAIIAFLLINSRKGKK